MNLNESKKFMEALKTNELSELRKISKSDLHNHFVLGGSRNFIKEKTGIEINPYQGIMHSIDEMHAWNEKYIGAAFDNSERRKLLIEAAFVQAKDDGIKILEIGEDVWGLGEYFDNDIVKLIETFQEINERVAPHIELRLQIGLSRHCPIDYLLDCLKHFWGHAEFYSIDLYGDEMSQPIENFIPIYQKAKENGLRLKAHIGEWGSASDVQKGIELLGLDEVQHGIAAAESEAVMQYIKEKKVQLNITPTSNIVLGRVAAMTDHPIKTLYRNGIDVTVNSDDVLIFDSDVSKEYLRLYQSGCLSAEELDEIRKNGLRKFIKCN